MGRDDDCKPPCPRIDVVAGNPSTEEAAAIAAALEQFLIESTLALAPEPERRWQRAALHEGVDGALGWSAWGQRH